MEGQLLKNLDLMTGQQLAKQLLALVMNPRPIPEKLASSIINNLLQKMDKVEAKDVFFLCIALGKGQGKISQDLVSIDIYYSIYIKLV